MLGMLFPFYSKHQVPISEKNIIYNLLNLRKQGVYNLLVGYIQNIFEISHYFLTDK